MAKKITTKKFIERAKLIHGERYEYNNVVYKGSHKKVAITCKTHGNFKQSPNSHLQGSGCKHCANQKPTTEQFIERAKAVHGDRYNYEKTVYVDSRTKVIIICKTHGEFLQRTNGHLDKRGCPSCAGNKLITTSQFIERALKKHGKQYDYSNVIYIGSETKVNIICQTHGIFEQTPTMHMRSSGCSRCAYDNSKKSTEEFIKLAIEIHGDTYDYSKSVYKNTDTNTIITCRIHGDFNKTPNSHLKGIGCPTCSHHGMRLTKEQFVEKAEKTHRDRYSYDSTIYVLSNKKLTITCREHGDFEQTPYNHMYGKGCPECNLGGTYRRSAYIKKANGRLCTFYTLRCFNEGEEFYKIGITVNSVKQRYHDIKSMPYSYEIVSEIFGEVEAIWNLEKSEKRKLKEFNYQPEIPFHGSKTECFTQYK